MMLLLLAMAAATQAADQPSPMRDTLDRGGKIVTSPARDVGAAKTTIPPVLEKARENPYGLVGIRTCGQLKTSIDALTKVLGPDFAVGVVKKENKVGKLAEAGGKTIVNAFVPFRGLVREISGAAPAQRRLDDAIDAGFARRGFLRGVAATRRCPGASR